MADPQNETPAAEQDAPAGESTAVAESRPASRNAPQLPPGQHYFWGTGRRKRAIARVRIRPGQGRFLVNGREVDTYFVNEQSRKDVREPLAVSRMAGSWDIWARVNGGGPTGQAGAITLGLARAISRAIPDLEHDLRDKGLLTRDARMTERKKPGQPGARRRFQFSKR
jgi:small subunit ribosomal protein S9